MPDFKSAIDIAGTVASGDGTALQVIQDTLGCIESANPALNCFTEVFAKRAQARAADVDAKVARGDFPGRLAGVPFAVKNLFDIEGVTTLAGSKINADDAPAAVDAPLIRRLEAEGAVLVGALSMGEYAYDFTGENQHYGACRNPWDTQRMSGGSSSGSGSATAAGLAPISLGSDTNGSIRVPASLCGLFGLKPTYGRLPRSGTYPFCDSLDHLGPMARTVSDLALSFDVLQGYDSGDSACADRAPLVTCASLEQGVSGLRIAVAGGYFECTDFPEAAAAVETVARALDSTALLPLEGASEGRAAAYVITNAESALLHRTHLQTRVEEFDADTRDRFLAGSLIPASWLQRAQVVRRWWQQQMLDVFRDVDLIIAPATPCSAPLLGTRTLMIRGEGQMLRPNLGLFTQPFSAIGLPVCAAPLQSDITGLPIGVQLVAPPWREDLCLRVAHDLERRGVVTCARPPVPG